MQAYAVFSSDCKNQVGFCDIRVARSANIATGGILDENPNRCHGWAWTIGELRDLIAEMETQQKEPKR